MEEPGAQDAKKGGKKNKKKGAKWSNRRANIDIYILKS